MQLELAERNAKIQFLKANGWYEYNGRWFKETEGTELELAYVIEQTEQKAIKDEHRNLH